MYRLSWGSGRASARIGPVKRQKRKPCIMAAAHVMEWRKRGEMHQFFQPESADAPTRIEKELKIEERFWPCRSRRNSQHVDSRRHGKVSDCSKTRHPYSSIGGSHAGRSIPPAGYHGIHHTELPPLHPLRFPTAAAETDAAPSEKPCSDSTLLAASATPLCSRANACFPASSLLLSSGARAPAQRTPQAP